MHLFPLISRHRLNSPLPILIQARQGGGTIFYSPRRLHISSHPEDPQNGSLSEFCPSDHPYPDCIYIRSWLSDTGTFLRALPFPASFIFLILPPLPEVSQHWRERSCSTLFIPSGWNQMSSLIAGYMPKPFSRWMVVKIYLISAI